MKDTLNNKTKILDPVENNILKKSKAIDSKNYKLTLNKSQNTQKFIEIKSHDNNNSNINKVVNKILFEGPLDIKIIDKNPETTIFKNNLNTNITSDKMINYNNIKLMKNENTNENKNVNEKVNINVMGNTNDTKNENDNAIIFSYNKSNNNETEYKKIPDEPDEFNRNDPIKKPADNYLFHSAITLSKTNLSFKEFKNKSKLKKYLKYCENTDSTLYTPNKDKKWKKHKHKPNKIFHYNNNLIFLLRDQIKQGKSNPTLRIEYPLPNFYLFNSVRPPERPPRAPPWSKI